MKNLFPLLEILLLAGACAKPQGTENVIELPEKSHVVQVDSVESGILLNPIGIAATGDYLVIANMHKDTIFDVFDQHSLHYLYSDLIYGGGPNDMSQFRWMRPWGDNAFYTVGLGVPLITQVKAGDKRMTASEKKMVSWDKDICQDIYPLEDDRFLIQPGQKEGGWILYQQSGDEVIDMPASPFQDEEPDNKNLVKTYQNRTAQVAVHPGKKRIAFFYHQFPYMRMFDFNGRIVKEGCVGEKITNPSAYFNQEYGYYSTCAYTDERIVVRYMPKDQKAGVTYFQVWDWEGNLLSRLEVQDEFYLFALSPNGKTLYAVKIDNDHLFWAKLPDIG